MLITVACSNAHTRRSENCWRPQREREALRRAGSPDTLKKLIGSFLEDRTDLAESTRYEWKRIADKHVIPSIGDLSAGEIRRIDVIELCEGIEAPVVANRTFEFIRTIYRWALRKDLLN